MDKPMEKSRKKTDLRVIKTRKALTEALYDLLCEKSLGDITVTELCERAMVRKATFYKHFACKEDLLTYMVSELQRVSLEENTIGYDEADPHSYYIGAFRYFMDFLDSNQAFVKSVLHSNASSVVMEILSNQVERDISEHLQGEALDTVSKAPDMLAAMYAGSIVGCGKWWIEQSEQPSIDEVVDRFAELIRRL